MRQVPQPPQLPLLVQHLAPVLFGPRRGVTQVVQRLCLALGHQFGLRLFPNGIQGDSRKGDT